MFKSMILITLFLFFAIIGFINGVRLIIENPINLLIGFLFSVAIFLITFISEKSKEFFNIKPNSPIDSIYKNSTLRIILIPVLWFLGVVHLVSWLVTPKSERVIFDLLLGGVLILLAVSFIRFKPNKS